MRRQKRQTMQKGLNCRCIPGQILRDPQAHHLDPRGEDRQKVGHVREGKSALGGGVERPGRRSWLCHPKAAELRGIRVIKVKVDGQLPCTGRVQPVDDRVRAL